MRDSINVLMGRTKEKREGEERLMQFEREILEKEKEKEKKNEREGGRFH